MSGSWPSGAGASEPPATHYIVVDGDETVREEFQDRSKAELYFNAASRLAADVFLLACCRRRDAMLTLKYSLRTPPATARGRK